MNNQKYILISLFIFIVLSFSFLAIWEKSQHKVKNGWFLYFENIENDSLNFVIENYSENTEFSWQLYADNNKIKEEKIQVLNKSKENVIIDRLPQAKSVKIIVSHSKEQREIYKNFE